MTTLVAAEKREAGDFEKKRGAKSRAFVASGPPIRRD